MLCVLRVTWMHRWPPSGPGGRVASPHRRGTDETPERRLHERRSCRKVNNSIGCSGSHARVAVWLLVACVWGKMPCFRGMLAELAGALDTVRLQLECICVWHGGLLGRQRRSAKHEGDAIPLMHV
eukprot:jgi/Ulvmu1/1688/UM115_0017.1